MEKEAKVIQIVSIPCKPEIEAKFNRWMDEVHIPMLLKFKGLKSATRYKMLDPRNEHSRYMTQYEFENKEAFEAYKKSPEFAAAMEEVGQSWQPGELEAIRREQYQLMNKHS